MGIHKKIMFREKFIALNVYIRKESSEISLSEMQERFLLASLVRFKNRRKNSSTGGIEKSGMSEPIQSQRKPRK